MKNYDLQTILGGLKRAKTFESATEKLVAALSQFPSKLLSEKHWWMLHNTCIGFGDDSSIKIERRPAVRSINKKYRKILVELFRWFDREFTYSYGKCYLDEPYIGGHLWYYPIEAMFKDICKRTKICTHAYLVNHL